MKTIYYSAQRVQGAGCDVRFCFKYKNSFLITDSNDEKFLIERVLFGCSISHEAIRIANNCGINIFNQDDVYRVLPMTKKMISEL